MRNKVLLMFMLAFFLHGAGCSKRLEKPVKEAIEPVEIPSSHFLTLTEEQLLFLDWHLASRSGAYVKDKRLVPGPAVEYDIYFPNNSPDSRSLDVVSSGEGGRSKLVGIDIRGYETYALKFTLASINGKSEPNMKQKLVAGAVIGPTDKGQLCTYEPVIMSFSDSEKTMVAKTPVSADRIFQIGFHVHMMNPEDWDSSGSILRLRIEPFAEDVDVNGIADPYSVISSVGAPVITSEPVTTATADLLYSYDVNAIDPDIGDTLTYSLSTKPDGMIINPSTGLILWRPASDKGGTKEVVIVKVADSDNIPKVTTQRFTIIIKPTPYKITKLEVVNGYNQRSRKTLLTDGLVGLVQSSDQNRLETNIGSYTSYDFSDISIPPNTSIRSVVVYVEHFEEERFAQGKLEWSIGKGWPFRRTVWASIKAPVHFGEFNEAVDSWDITSLVDTNEKINSLQLEVKNDNNVVNSKTLINHIYMLVKLE